MSCAPRLVAYVRFAVAALGLALCRLEASEGLPTAPPEVASALFEGDLAAALRHIDTLLGTETVSERDYLIYLKGLCHSQQGQAEAAAAAFRRLLSEHPRSTWHHKGRFHLAETLRQLRQHREAEEIYESEARRLLAAGRKRELAEVYFSVADRLARPADPAQPDAPQPDYQRARSLYDKALELEPPAAAREHARFERARASQALGEWDQAVADYERYLAEFDPSRQPEGGKQVSPGARIFEARHRGGECLLAAGRPADARRRWEDLESEAERALNSAGVWSEPPARLDDSRKDEARRFRAMALFDIARTFPPAAGTPGAGGGTLLANASLRRFLAAYPQDDRAPLAAFTVATNLLAAGRDIEAGVALDLFLAGDGFTAKSDKAREDAAALRTRATFLKGEVLLRQRKFTDAVRAWNEYVAAYPTGADWAAAQQRIIEAEFLHGAHLRVEEDFAAARKVWSDFLERHPLSNQAVAVLFLLGELWVEEAGKLVRGTDVEHLAPEQHRRHAELHAAAIDQWRKVLSKYPGSEDASRALFRTAEVQEVVLKDLEKAIETYRRLDWGGFALEAKARLARMTSPELTVSSERVWRTNEPPVIRLETRNIPEVTVELYRLDLEAYYRKHHAVRGVEDLDLDLIRPDQGFQAPIQDYARYKPIEQRLDLPIEGAGVFAVAVTAGKLRATTLVVRSDIDVVVKCSRRELFVFAEDMVAGTPRAGVRVLAHLPGAGAEAAGLSTIEGQTGDDGVFFVKFGRGRGEGIHPLEADEVSVLASDGGHFASNSLGLQGLGVSQGLEPRGFVYTDRPVYRPGQEVHLRAILRETRAGAYAFEPGRSYRLSVADSQGRAFHTTTLALSAFGTVHASFGLDRLTPVGTYTATLQAEEGPSFNGSFVVAEYQLERIELRIDLPRDVYYRGETIEGDITARYYYGEPVAGAAIRYVLPDGRVVTTRTSEAGTAKLRFDTSPLAAEGTFVLRAGLTEEKVSAERNVFLALHEYSAAVSTPREVYLAGEPFDATVATKSPAGEPVGRTMKLSLVRREASPVRAGRGLRSVATWSEVLVKEWSVVTDARTGSARQTATIAGGGRYVLRAEAADRFGNTVSAEKHVFVSGNDDDVELRILSERQELVVGETAAVRLHLRGKPALSLVTFEGEEMLDYRIIKLAEGVNDLSFSVSGALFPNFTLAASVLRTGSFHAAHADFDASRGLRISVRPEREAYAPGEAVEVDLEVTDQAGRPAAAEISLAVVDDALLSRYPELASELQTFFAAGARRVAAMRTSASSTFRYTGATKMLDGAVWQMLEQAQEGGVGGQTMLGAQELVLYESHGSFGNPLVDLGAYIESAGVDVFLGQSAGIANGHTLTHDLSRVLNDYGRVPPMRQAQLTNLSTERLAAAPAPVRDRFLETAFWAPAVVADAAGHARVTFPLPAQATRWRLVARGVTADTSLGEASAALVARKDFFVEVKLPAVLNEGDAPRFAVRVHNVTGKAGKASLRLRLGLAGAATDAFLATVEVPASGAVEHVFPAAKPLAASGSLRVEADAALEAEGGVREDRVAHEVSVRPWGLEVFASESGLLGGEASMTLELPAGREYRDRALRVILGGGLEQVLVEEGLGKGDWPRGGASASTQAEAASDLLGTLAVLEYVRSRGVAGGAAATAHALLADRAQAAVAQLVAAQRQDGGWAWAGQKQASDPRTSALAMWALGRARKLGISVPPQTLEPGLRHIHAAFNATPHEHNELKAMLLHSLAVHGEADFGFLNRLYRLRPSLSPAALAYTALALVEMEKAPIAAEVAEVLEKHAGAVATLGSGTPGASAQSCWRVDGNDAFHRSPLEMTALAVLALERTLPRSPLIARGVEHLLASRPWHPRKARGAILAALAHHALASPAEAVNARVAVTIDGKALETVNLDGAGARTVEVPAELLARDRVRIDLALLGRGRPSFVALLSAFSRDMSPGGEGPVAVRAHVYAAAPPTYHGRDVPTGFGVVEGRLETWENAVTKLPSGGMTKVRLELDGRRDASGRPRRVDYLVVDCYLPAGASVLEGSVSGSFDHFEAGDGRLTFYLSSREGLAALHYTLLGVLPGAYRVPPAVARSAYDPSLVALGAARSLEVLARGETSNDPYRQTPTELFELGKALFDDGRAEAARQPLESLLADWRDSLRANFYRETIRMLFFASLERDDPAAVVKYFEAIKEKYPELTVPFEKVLRVGDAYASLGEHERALLVFRAAIEETFGLDLKVAGALEAESELAGAMRTLESLWLEFPDLPVVVQSYLLLADKYFAKAPAAASDAALKRAGLGRAELLRLAADHQTRFIHLYAKDPLAGDAALSLMTSYVAMEDYPAAVRLASRFEKRALDPVLQDHVAYSRAVASWYLGDYDAAVDLARKVSTAQYTDSLGRRVESENKNLAIYILGQIFHAQRKVADAIEHYERVSEHFPDARETIAHFRQKRLSLDEVTSAQPGKPVAVTVRFRNVEEAELLVYAVDLMTLYLREKNLSRVSAVNLAGITPTLRQKVRLGNRQDFVDQEESVTLPLDTAGAYLAICRSGDLHASGLVLVTPLQLDVSAEAASGRVRVNVQRRGDGSFVRGVNVKVVGSSSGELVSGTSDPRGIFVADGIAGTATVIAREGTAHYAFHRGTEHLGPDAPPPPTAELLVPPALDPAAQPEANAAAHTAGKQQQERDVNFFSNVMGCNDSKLNARAGGWQKEVAKDRKGIQALQAK